jgi:hypothetical protein
MQINPFATEAVEYAHLRPTYPEGLFEFLATVVARATSLGTAQRATVRRRRTWQDTSGRS